MKVDKQSSSGEGGRHVNGFRHLFDWNAKSRKKLLATSLSEQSKHNISNNTNMPIIQYHPVIENYTEGSLILNSRASSLIDDDEYSKAPGVVARLMGLDSFPTSNLSDTKSKSTRIFDTRSMQASSAFYTKKAPELEHKGCHQLDQKHKVIEKFQTESLPPKSARLVPITQQKLLSPIKRSGFTSLSDPTRIMEATSKVPLVGSSSVHVPARKAPSCRKPVESKVLSRRVVESNAARSLKGQSMNKSWDGCLERKPLLEGGKRSVSLAIQAKVNVKKRESLSLSGESISGQQNSQKDTLKKPSTNNVLKQNKQKQNCLLDRRISAAKSSVSSINSQCRKPVSDTSKFPVNKAINRQKRSMEDVKNKVHDKNDRSGNVVRSNVSDVVSFTFTSPISCSEKKNILLTGNHSKNTPSNFVGNRNRLNIVMGGDSVSTLLEQKLKKNVSLETGGDSLITLLNQKLKKNVSLPIGGDSLSTLVDKKLRELTATSSVSVSIIQDLRDPDRIKSSFLRGNCISRTTDFSNKCTMTKVDTESETRYVKGILSNIESMFEDFTLNRTSKIVNTRLFDRLEAQRTVLEKKHELRLRRKLIFDCVSECVDSRCRIWSRGVAVVGRKERLVEDVCKKITKWENMKDCMVDELVYKDMTDDQPKTWLYYDVEMFELGVEIENRLLSSLISNALVDMLVLCR